MIPQLYKYLTFIILIHISGSEIFAQVGFTFDDYYEDGEQALYSYFYSNPVKYPATSISSASIGLSVAEMLLSPKGKILTINIINPINEQIDLQVIQSIKGTAGKWEKRDTDDTIKLYFQFRFRIITENFNQQNYTFIANDRFLLPVFITTIDFENEYITITPDDSLAIFTDRAIKDKNYTEAAFYLDELIRRNPYYLQFYQLRISVNSKLKNIEQVDSDLKKIADFADGIPLNQILVADYMELKQMADTSYSESVYVIVEQMPEFPGGEVALYNFIHQSLIYPEEARSDSIQGRVWVTFVVDTDGFVTDVGVMRGIGYGCDEEAVRLIKSMPRWKPGLQHGETVRIKYNLPVRFSLD